MRAQAQRYQGAGGRRALIVGAGGVGESMAAIAKRRDPEGDLFEKIVLADYDLARAQGRPSGSARSASRLSRSTPATPMPSPRWPRDDVDIICNMLPVNYAMPMMRAALKAGAIAWTAA